MIFIFISQMLDGFCLILSGIISWHKTPKNFWMLYHDATVDNDDNGTFQNFTKLMGWIEKKKHSNVIFTSATNPIVSSTDWIGKCKTIELRFIDVCYCRYPRLNWMFCAEQTAYLHSKIECKAFFRNVSSLRQRVAFIQWTQQLTCVCHTVRSVFGFVLVFQLDRFHCTMLSVCFHRAIVPVRTCVPLVNGDCARFSHWNYFQAEHNPNAHWNNFDKHTLKCYAILFTYIVSGNFIKLKIKMHDISIARSPENEKKNKFCKCHHNWCIWNKTIWRCIITFNHIRINGKHFSVAQLNTKMYANRWCQNTILPLIFVCDAIVWFSMWNVKYLLDCIQKLRFHVKSQYNSGIFWAWNAFKT